VFYLLLRILWWAYPFSNKYIYEIKTYTTTPCSQQGQLC
jgi:hypothetical protein